MTLQLLKKKSLNIVGDENHVARIKKKMIVQRNGGNAHTLGDDVRAADQTHQPSVKQFVN